MTRALIVGPMGAGQKGLYVGDALRRLGVEVDAYDDWHYGLRIGKVGRYAQRAISSSSALEGAFIRGVSDRAFLRAVERARPDLLLLLRADRISPDALRRAKQRSGVVASWLPDGADHPAFARATPFFRHVDHVFVKDSAAIPRLEADGVRARFLPQSCSRDAHRRLRLDDAARRAYGSDVALVSTITSERVELARQLLRYDLRIWCDLPKVQLRGHPDLQRRAAGRRAFGEDQSRVFNAAKVVINLHRRTDVNGLNLRVFEVAGCGGFQLTDAKRDLPASFEPGEEVVTFRTLDEVPELVARYLDDEPRRASIADRAYRRAHREHTYEHRLRALADACGIATEKPPDEVP